MDTIFISSENSKTSDPYRLLLNLSDGINSKRSNKYVALSNLSIYYTGEKLKGHTKTINLKYRLRGGMKSSNYLLDHIVYKIFKIISDISSENMKQ